MAISTNSVFHFTKNKTSLKGILKNNFQPNYCFESIEIDNCPEVNTKDLKVKKGEDISISGGIPMVSFCDIPLSQVKEHINKYGFYSIGLTKDWAKRNGLNPVLYFEQSSKLAHSTLLNLTVQLFNRKGDKAVALKDKPLTEIFRYSKNNTGELIRKGKLVNEKYKYFDEREWRYCPTESELNGAPFMISVNFEDYSQVKNQFNKEISSLRLDFDPNDISYIIIKSEKEISEMINHLENTKGKNYSYQEIRRLTTRIITIDQIINDF